MLKHAAIVAALLFGTGTAIAQDKATDKPAQKETQKGAKKLSVGDPAPALSIEKWVKGEEITGMEKGKVYVLDFWATWCGPCVASMPHVTELQKKFKNDGVTIIGVTSKDSRNTLERVEKMVSDKGDVMGYTVAWDKGRETNDAYMQAADQHYIPRAFVIDRQGTLAAIVYPDKLGMVLEKVVAGKWDAKKDGAALAAVDEATEQIQSERDPAAALAKIEAFEKKHPDEASQFAMMKMQLQVATGDLKGAAATAQKAYEQASASKNAMALNGIAWMLVDPDTKIEHPDLNLALKAATEASDLTGNKDAAILDTLARVYWLKGEKSKARETQQKAVDLADDQMKDELKQRLDEYKAGK